MELPTLTYVYRAWVLILSSTNQEKIAEFDLCSGEHETHSYYLLVNRDLPLIWKRISKTKTEIEG